LLIQEGEFIFSGMRWKFYKGCVLSNLAVWTCNWNKIIDRVTYEKL